MIVSKDRVDQLFNRLVSLMLTIFVWGMSIYGLVLFIRETDSEFYKTLSTFFNFITDGNNVNRLGLVFQLVGIFAVFPELLKRSDSERWERWFHHVGSNDRILKFSFRDLFLIRPAVLGMTRGPFGLVNLFSRSIICYFLVINLPALWENAGNFGLDIALSARSLVLILSFFLALWVLSTIFDLCSALLNIESSKEFRIFYLLLSSPLILNSLFIYIPIALLVFIVLSSLRGISDYSIEQIATRATFPFVLFGSLLELIATFM